MTLILSTTNAAFLTTDQICFTPSEASNIRIDDIQIIADDLTNTRRQIGQA